MRILRLKTKLCFLLLALAVAIAALFAGSVLLRPASAEEEPAPFKITGINAYNDNIFVLNTDVALSYEDKTPMTVFIDDVETELSLFPNGNALCFRFAKTTYRKNDSEYLHVRIPEGTTVGSGYVLSEEYNFYDLYNANTKDWHYVGQETTVPFSISGIAAMALEHGGVRWYIAMNASFGEGVTVNGDAIYNCGIVYATADDDIDGGYTVYGAEGNTVNVLAESNTKLGILMDWTVFGASGSETGYARMYKIPAGTIWGGHIGRYRLTNDVWMFYNGKTFTYLNEAPVFIDAGAAEIADGQTADSGFTVTLAENAVPYASDWSYNSNQSSARQLTVNGVGGNLVYLKKYTQTQYYVCIGDKGITAAENDYVTLDGYFYYGNYFYKIADTSFVYSGGAWKRVAPEIVVKNGGETVTGDLIAVEIGTASSALTATAGDRFDENIPVSVLIPDEAILDGRFVEGSYEVKFTAVDSKGYTTEIVKTLKVADTVAPVITVNGVKTEYDEGETLSYDVSATDNIDGDIEVVLHAPEEMTDESGRLLPGSWTIYFTASDSADNVTTSENYTIAVRDKVPPVVTLGGKVEYEAGTSYSENSLLELTASATDNYDETVDTFEVVMQEGAVADGRLQKGTWTVTVSASDKAGNKGSASIEITVSDTTAPVITIDKAQTKIQYNEGEEPEIVAAATDSYEGAVSVEIAYPEGALSDGKLVLGSGEWILTLTATDGSGNIATETLKIFVEAKDGVKPVITLSGPTEYTEGDELALTATATDDVDGVVKVSVTLPDGALDGDGKLVAGSWTIVFTATDAAGNLAEERAEITVTAKQTTGEEPISVGGCGSAVYGTGIAACVLAAAAILLFLKKRNAV